VIQQSRTGLTEVEAQSPTSLPAAVAGPPFFSNLQFVKDPTRCRGLLGGIFEAKNEHRHRFAGDIIRRKEQILRQTVG
jgi:hypothetical protein